ncbi:MAG: hypothetical protein ACXWVG_15290 [Telluria sp.]
MREIKTLHPENHSRRYQTAPGDVTEHGSTYTLKQIFLQETGRLYAPACPVAVPEKKNAPDIIPGRLVETA